MLDCRKVGLNKLTSLRVNAEFSTLVNWASESWIILASVKIICVVFRIVLFVTLEDTKSPLCFEA